MKITKGACFGQCPVYTLSVYKGGYAVLGASRFGIRQGKFYKRLDKATYKSLIAAYDASNFYSLPDKYESEVADFPLISLYYQTKKGEKYVRGKDRRPAPIMAIQKIFDQIYEEDNWKLLEAKKEMVQFEPEQTHEVSRGDPPPKNILVKTGEDMDMEAWVKNYSKYDVRLVRRVSQSMNVYLITYDPSKVNGLILLNKIKKDKSILMAQFDKKVSQRTDR